MTVSVLNSNSDETRSEREVGGIDSGRRRIAGDSVRLLPGVLAPGWGGAAPFTVCLKLSLQCLQGVLGPVYSTMVPFFGVLEAITLQGLQNK